MTDTYFIDSDICLDALTNRSPFSKNAIQILYLAETKKIIAVTSSLSFSNMFYLLSKWSSVSKAYTQLSKLKTIISIASVREQEVDASLASKWRDFEDAIQYHSALPCNCSAIITRNKSDYKKSEIPVLSPDEFLRFIGSN
ncbi:MAG: PIN domain-containing protein [Balneolaceae bacterium]